MKDATFQDLVENYDSVYRFVLLSMDQYSKPRDYGTGDMLNMVEMHTLSLIAQNPGISISEVAKRCGRTSSAASQTANRIEKKGFIVKKRDASNYRVVALFTTKKGEHLNKLHTEYDKNQLKALMNYLTTKFSTDEIATFISVIKFCIEIFETERQGNPRPY